MTKCLSKSSKNKICEYCEFQKYHCLHYPQDKFFTISLLYHVMVSLPLPEDPSWAHATHLHQSFATYDFSTLFCLYLTPPLATQGHQPTYSFLCSQMPQALMVSKLSLQALQINQVHWILDLQYIKLSKTLFFIIEDPKARFQSKDKSKEPPTRSLGFIGCRIVFDVLNHCFSCAKGMNQMEIRSASVGPRQIRKTFKGDLLNQVQIMQRKATHFDISAGVSRWL